MRDRPWQQGGGVVARREPDPDEHAALGNGPGAVLRQGVREHFGRFEAKAAEEEKKKAEAKPLEPKTAATVEPPHEEWNNADVEELPGKNYLFIGARYRGNVIPQFMAYWTANGGLAQFGYPISELVTETLEDGKPYQLQYFERARFELHPENQPPYDVLLGQFGRRILGNR